MCNQRIALDLAVNHVGVFVHGKERHRTRIAQAVEVPESFALGLGHVGNLRLVRVERRHSLQEAAVLGQVAEDLDGSLGRSCRLRFFYGLTRNAHSFGKAQPQLRVIAIALLFFTQVCEQLLTQLQVVAVGVNGAHVARERLDVVKVLLRVLTQIIEAERTLAPCLIERVRQHRVTLHRRIERAHKLGIATQVKAGSLVHLGPLPLHGRRG